MVLINFQTRELQSIHLVLNTKSVVGTIAREMAV